MRPYIKRTLKDVIYTFFIVMAIAFWMWIAFLPFFSLYGKVNAIRKDINKIQGSIVELKIGIEEKLH